MKVANPPADRGGGLEAREGHLERVGDADQGAEHAAAGEGGQDLRAGADEAGVRRAGGDRDQVPGRDRAVEAEPAAARAAGAVLGGADELEQGHRGHEAGEVGAAVAEPGTICLLLDLLARN